MDFLIPSASARHRLAAARSRFGSDSSLNCHSLPNRHSASLHYLTIRGGFVLCGPPGGRPLRVDALHFVGAHHDAPDKVVHEPPLRRLFKKRCILKATPYNTYSPSHRRGRRFSTTRTKKAVVNHSL